MKILLATDGSSGSEAAIRQIASRPWPDGSVVKVLSVVELFTTKTPENFWVPESYYLKLEQSLQEQARMAVERAETQLREQAPQLDIETDIVSGIAKEVIIDEAESWGADIIILGSHGYKGLKKLWYGSVSHAVAAHAGCTVEIVRSAHA